MSEERAAYRVFIEMLPGLGRFHWWALNHLPSKPNLADWFRRVEQGALHECEKRGVVPIGDPLTAFVRRGDRYVLTASVMAIGPDGLADGEEHGPTDVVDRERCPNCGSLDTRLHWAAVDTSDWDGWTCTDCDHRWVR